MRNKQRKPKDERAREFAFYQRGEILLDNINLVKIVQIIANNPCNLALLKTAREKNCRNPHWNYEFNENFHHWSICLL